MPIDTNALIDRCITTINSQLGDGLWEKNGILDAVNGLEFYLLKNFVRNPYERPSPTVRVGVDMRDGVITYEVEFSVADERNYMGQVYDPVSDDSFSFENGFKIGLFDTFLDDLTHVLKYVKGRIDEFDPSDYPSYQLLPSSNVQSKDTDGVGAEG